MGEEALLTWADLALAGVVLTSLLVGAIRGLVFEVLSLGAWVVAYFSAPFLAPVVQGWLPEGQGDWQEMASLVGAFVLVLVLVSLTARLLRSLIHATPLKGVDRLLGSGFGLVRGGLLCLLAGVLIGLTPMRSHPSWTGSHARPMIAVALQSLQPMLPKNLHHLLSRPNAGEPAA